MSTILYLLPFAFLSGLGSDCWRERERSSLSLSRSGLAAYPAIVAGCRSPDPEIAARCRMLHVRLVAWSIGTEPEYGWIDWQAWDATIGTWRYDVVSSAMVAGYVRQSDRGPGEWPHYRSAMRRWLIDQARDGVPLETLRRWNRESLAVVADFRRRRK